MISHKNRLIFIHIPKTGGSSIENLFGAAPFNPEEPDYENLVGWCPIRKFYMQHATPAELLETGLVSKKTFYEYEKIAIVRNTYTRLVSDYYWHKNILKSKAGFLRYLLAMQPFRERNENAKGTLLDYSSHVRSQLDYLFLNGEVVIDRIYRFEHFSDIIHDLKQRFEVEKTEALHERKGRYTKPYNELYNFITKNIVDRKYKEEINYFKFKF